ncbi:hypothetical protein D3C81_1830220 [compost metagenome]
MNDMFEPLMPKSLKAQTVPATTPAAAGLARPMNHFLSTLPIWVLKRARRSAAPAT